MRICCFVFALAVADCSAKGQPPIANPARVATPTSKCGSAAPGDSAHSETARTLRDYPQTEAFVAFTNAQLDEACHRDDLLAILAFCGGDHADRVALACAVTKTGRESDVRDVYNWAAQDAHSKQLAQPELMRLSAALRQLPASATPPPIERLVIISFRDGAEWVTRAYDRQSLSIAMHEIYDVVGERCEPREL